MAPTMKTRTLITTLTAAILLITMAAGLRAETSGAVLTDTVLEGHQIIRAYWEKLDAWYAVEEYPYEDSSEIGQLEQTYVEKARSYRNRCEDFARQVISTMKRDDIKLFYALSACYKKLHRLQKRALDPVASMIVEQIQADLLNNDGTLIALIPEEHQGNILREYFPGYGYSDPRYKHRKGRETKREFIQAFWKTEKETIQSTNYMEMTIEASLLPQLETQVQFLKILKLFNIEINGQIVAAAKVSFQVTKTLVTECRVRYAKNKVWFELWRKDKLDLWGNTWELCGETYEFFEEPTGEEIVTSTRFLE